MLLAKREVFDWIAEGKKTIDIRKGTPWNGDTIMFVSGPRQVTVPILKKATGTLQQLVTDKNCRQVIPTAKKLQDAYDYLHRLYGDYNGQFTAYYLGKIRG